MGELTRDEIKSEMGRSLPDLELTDNLVDLVFTITSGMFFVVISHCCITWCLWAELPVFFTVANRNSKLPNCFSLAVYHLLFLQSNKQFIVGSLHLYFIFNGFSFFSVAGNAYWCKAMTQFIKDQGAQALFAAVR